MHVLCKHLLCVISIVRCAHKLKAGAEKRSDKRPGESRPDIDDTKCLIALGTILAVFSPTPPPPHTPQPRSNQQTQLTNFHTFTPHTFTSHKPPHKLVLLASTAICNHHCTSPSRMFIDARARTEPQGVHTHPYQAQLDPRPPLRRVAKQGSRSTKFLRWNRPLIFLTCNVGGCHPPHSPAPSRH